MSPAHRSIAMLPILAAAPPAGPGWAAPPGSVRDAIEERIAASGGEVAVAFRLIDGSDELLLRSDDAFHAASTMKVPVLIELYRRAAAGELSLEDPLEVSNAFESILDGSPYSLSPEQDSETGLYGRIGHGVPLGMLSRAMIQQSSNLATNLLIQRLGVERIRATTAALGAEGMHVLRGVEDTKAYQAGMSNATTARALMRRGGACRDRPSRPRARRRAARTAQRIWMS